MDYRQIIAIFIPILIDQAFIYLLSLMNTAMISSSGVEAVSAVNMIDSLNLLAVSCFIAVATGGTVIVAQYKGSGNHAMVGKASASAIASVSLLAFGSSLILLIFHNPILELLFGSASEEVLAHAKTYFIGSCTSYLGLGIVHAVSGTMRGIGKTKVSLSLSLIMNLLYVLLNVIFVILLDTGVIGLSISLNIARYAAAICAIIYVIRVDETLQIRLHELLHVPWNMLKKIMHIGFPFATEQLFFNGGKMVTQIFIVSLGTHAIATNAIGGTLAMVTQIPANALSMTLVTVVGQCMGRRDVADARKFIKLFVVLSSVSLLLMALIVMPFFHPIVSIFNPPEEIIDDLFWLTLINIIAQIPLWSISFIVPAGLRAAGDSRFTSITAMLSMWLFRIVLGYIFGITLGYGILGIWIAMNCEWGVRGILFLWRLKGKKWYAHRLIEEPDKPAS